MDIGVRSSNKRGDVFGWVCVICVRGKFSQLDFNQFNFSDKDSAWGICSLNRESACILIWPQLPRTSSKVTTSSIHSVCAIESCLESFHKILEKSIGQFQRYLKFLISYVIKVLGFFTVCSLIRAKLRSRALYLVQYPKFDPTLLLQFYLRISRMFDMVLVPSKTKKLQAFDLTKIWIFFILQFSAPYCSAVLTVSTLWSIRTCAQIVE